MPRARRGPRPGRGVRRRPAWLLSSGSWRGTRDRRGRDASERAGSPGAARARRGVRPPYRRRVAPGRLPPYPRACSASSGSAPIRREPDRLDPDLAARLGEGGTREGAPRAARQSPGPPGVARGVPEDPV